MQVVRIFIFIIEKSYGARLQRNFLNLLRSGRTDKVLTADVRYTFRVVPRQLRLSSLR